MEIFKIFDLSDNQLEIALKKHNIWLKISEARKISKILWRDPTMTEAIIWGNQWSEHASYKSTRNYLKTLPTSGPDVILWPTEDSWVIKLCDLPNWDSYWIVVSHESHNSPSQIVPYEWAATWVWWIMRDIVCMWSKAIWVLDCLRFWSLDVEKSKIIAKWCVDWIWWYGNPIWVPNLWWDIYFDKQFEDYCLVNVFAVWLIKESQIIHSFAPKEAWNLWYDYILVWKPTDNSWFGWAAFSSKNINELNYEENKWAVQEPNPFLERHLMASTYDLFKKLENDWNLWRVGYKDLWAWWVICASVELVDGQWFWWEVYLDDIHKSIDNMKPEVIACSETQERFMWVCHPELTEMILSHYNDKWALWEVSKWAKASKIWKVVKWGQYKMYYKWELVCDAKAKNITEWILYDREVTQALREFCEPNISIKDTKIIISDNWSDVFSMEIKEIAKNIISSANLASSECVFEKYDKSVQANTFLERWETQASVISPLKWINLKWNLNQIWISLAQTWSWRYWLISAYYQASHSVSKACMLVASVWASPICITDCLNYANPEIPEQMWEFSQWIKWIKDACLTIGNELNGSNLPIISWNVSLYKNVPPSSIIWCVGKMDNYKNAISKKIKWSDNILIMIWKRLNELWWSEFYKNITLDKASNSNICDNNWLILWKNVVKSNFKFVADVINAMDKLISEKKILSSNVISTWWLYSCIIDMIMPNQKDTSFDLWIEINCDIDVNTELQFLFSESLWILIEIKPEDKDIVLEMFWKYAQIIWKTTSNKKLEFSWNINNDWWFSNNEIYKLWYNWLRKYWS